MIGFVAEAGDTKMNKIWSLPSKSSDLSRERGKKGDTM